MVSKFRSSNFVYDMCSHCANDVSRCSGRDEVITVLLMWIWSVSFGQVIRCSTCALTARMMFQDVLAVPRSSQGS